MIRDSLRFLWRFTALLSNVVGAIDIGHNVLTWNTAHSGYS